MSDRPLDLLVVGDADVDVYVRAPRRPGPGEKVLGQLLGVHPGGMGVNVACAAARLGLRAGMVAAIGDDAHGRMALDHYRELGVDAQYVRQIPAIATYVSVVTLDEAGEKSLVVADGGALFPPADLLADVDLAAARAVHLVPFDLERAIWTAEAGRRAGALVSVDLEPTMVTDRLAVTRLLQVTDLLFCNHYTALAFGETIEEGIAALRAQGAPVVVMTAGADGAVVHEGTDCVRVPAAPATVVDTTGAGDCFAAGFLGARLHGADLAAAARTGAAVAAAAIGSIGGSAGVRPVAWT
ncbi:ribokinase [Pseudonocardia aurantiaca]|uniref:Carbohydrate kinase family protein n=1 Tax=Pseudonocardia aurantiaca TaxID=75290 RepID=A0ABW4FG77_9PSEU